MNTKQCYLVPATTYDLKFESATLWIVQRIHRDVNFAHFIARPKT